MKKIREEIVLHPGMSLPIAFHSLLFDLYTHDIYIPLSLFTSPNLELINSSSATLATRKLNALNPGQKQPIVLDTEAFEQKYQTEGALDRAQWIEAARNYVSFIEEASGDRNSAASTRWNAHFGHFEHVEQAQENFPAILTTDIRLRKKYISLPFVFDPVFYARDLDRAIADMRMGQMEARLGGGSSSHSNAGGRGGASGGGNGGGRGAAPNGNRGGRGGGTGGGGGGRPPFQQGNGGDAPPVVCLLCARRGHFWNHCPSTTFDDNTALFGVGRGADICSVRSGQALCRAWNAKGPTAACSHDPTQRAHHCTFCGSRDHHAFSWSCRRNPPN